MTNKEFIKRVAQVAVADWKVRRIMLPSVVIAQAILESAWGESELALKALALFGIKENGWTGKAYIKAATEQRADGSYYTVDNTKWRAYNSWDESITDHNNYIATKEVSAGVLRYAAIIGNTDYKKVCQLLKDCGYATDISYPDKLITLITKHKLTQYDAITEEGIKMIKVAIDAGHGLKTSGKRCKKSIDPKETSEWYLNDRIADQLQAALEAYGCGVLRVDDTTGAKDISLSNRVKIANNWGADIYISIHHNAGINGGSGGGTVVYYYSSKSYRRDQALKLYNSIVRLTGLIGNRSSKVIKYGFYVIKNTNMPAFLIENGFMDSTTDTPIILTEAHAQKTARGILDFLVSEYNLVKLQPKDEVTAEGKALYKVQCGAFSVKANAEALRNKLAADGYEAVIVSGSQ